MAIPGPVRLLFALCFAAVLSGGVAHGGGMTTFYSFDVRATDAEVLVTVNGIPVELFTSGQFGSGPMNAWMMNGVNRIEFIMTPQGDDARATASIEISGPDSVETPVTFEWPGQKDPAIFDLTVADLPTWSWLKAEAVPNAEAEVTAAVQQLHAALEKGEEAEFRAMAAALYADAANQATPEQLDAGFHQMWTAFRKNLQPLGDLVITSYRDGQVYRVRGAGDRAPIQSVDDEDGGVFFMGAWWGKIDGAWQLIK